MGYTAYPLYVAKLFPLRVYLSRKDLSFPSLATILELQEIYSNQDTTARVIAKLTSFEDVYFHREEKGEETRWNFERNPSFHDGWKGTSLFVVSRGVGDVSVNDSDICWVDILSHKVSCIRYINYLCLMEIVDWRYVRHQDKIGLTGIACKRLVR